MSGIGCFPFMHGLHNGCSWSTQSIARASPTLRLKALLGRARNLTTPACFKMKRLCHTPLCCSLLHRVCRRRHKPPVRQLARDAGGTNLRG